MTWEVKHEQEVKSKSGAPCEKQLKITEMWVETKKRVVFVGFGACVGVTPHFSVSRLHNVSTVNFPCEVTAARVCLKSATRSAARLSAFLEFTGGNDEESERFNTLI